MTNIPDVHANDREIPAGKVLLAEYGEVGADELRATPELLEEATGHFGRTIKLEAIPAGWAIAGSMLRWDNGCFRVSVEIDNALHGRRYADIDAARATFAAWRA